jgi:hypothetical protein
MKNVNDGKTFGSKIETSPKSRFVLRMFVFHPKKTPLTKNQKKNTTKLRTK